MRQPRPFAELDVAALAAEVGDRVMRYRPQTLAEARAGAAAYLAEHFEHMPREHRHAVVEAALELMVHSMARAMPATVH